MAPGTYTGTGNRNLDFQGKDLVLRSEAGARLTIVDVAGSDEDPARGILLGPGLTQATVLEGFTILNGFMVQGTGPTAKLESEQRHDLSGAGIMIRGFCSPTVRDCVVRNCFSQFTGGGLGVELGAAPRLENIVVTGCAAGIQGGGISVETGADATLIGCVLTGNRSINGGAAHFSPGAATLTDCLLAGNAADGRGGGIDVILFARVRLERTILWNNCGGDGRSVFVDPAIAAPDADGFLQLECCVVDTTSMSDVANVTEFVADNVFTDPFFCMASACGEAPTSSGDYAVAGSSPALPQNSPCGATIGPSTHGCASPVRNATWSRLKSLYRQH